MALLTGHEELGVGVEVDEDLETLAFRKAAKEFGVRLGFGGVALRGTTEGFVAGVRRGAWSFPLVRPVAVEVDASALGALVGLTVLAPHAVSLLGENEAVRVDDREEVNVVLVDESLDLLVRSVAGQDRVDDVLHSLYNNVSNDLPGELKLTYHCSDPFTGVDGAVEDGSRFGALLASPDVDTGDVAAFVGLAFDNNLGVVGVSSLDVVEPLHVVIVAVIGVEPSVVQASGYTTKSVIKFSIQ